MNALMLITLSLFCFVLAYIFYGKYLAKKLGIDAKRETPAHSLRDDVDYVPAKAPVLLGHHFASIAGAAPIIGPITAAVFGWVPVFLWILFGNIFIGAVHDLTSLVVSIRHKGQSIGKVIEAQIGQKGKQLFLIFSWATLVLIISAFAILVAQTFVTTPAVATSSVLFIALAIFFGISIYRVKASLGVATLVGILLLLLCVWLGVKFPFVLSQDKIFSQQIWTWILFAYIFAASVTPVWILLQPRDYLNSFLLYIVLFGAFVGIIFSNPALKFPAFTNFTDPNLGAMFPILFVTVACGAISGFHSLVASGTTAKQLNKETDAKPIGYGAMLIEGLLAIIALITVAKLAQSEYSVQLADLGVIGFFSKGVGNFVTKLGIPLNVGITFAALAETQKQKILTNRFTATLLTILPAGILAFSGSYKAIWPIFGAANQLLAALALLAGSVWLAKKQQKNYFLRYPMYFMFAVTLSALIVLIYKNIQIIVSYYTGQELAKNFSLTGTYLLSVIAILLFSIAIVLVIEAYKQLAKTSSK
ncbi:carbon starvation protein A [candidate division KSB1 bacterium 4572_119]|nr:MAG: carbon starvation protein A [candidate division KSB1 bacterium 4572_119]